MTVCSTLPALPRRARWGPGCDTHGTLRLCAMTSVYRKEGHGLAFGNQDEIWKSSPLVRAGEQARVRVTGSPSGSAARGL